MTAGPFTVFLDRDGVFNVHKPKPMARPELLEIFDDAPAAFARLNRSDIQTALCTNQPWVGMGLATRASVRRTNEHLRTVLQDAGGRLDHIEAALAPPGIGNRRRKPRPGMLEDAAKWFAVRGTPVDKKRAVMVGDKPRDAQAGAAFGIPSIVLATTQDEATLQRRLQEVDVAATIVADLAAAVDLILAAADGKDRLDNA